LTLQTEQRKKREAEGIFFDEELQKRRVVGGEKNIIIYDTYSSTSIFSSMVLFLF
jgi:hypothetical protein